jgi:hypothetical protein
MTALTLSSFILSSHIDFDLITTTTRRQQQQQQHEEEACV